MPNTWASTTAQRRLREADIVPTLQRLVVAAVMLQRPVHMTAEQALRAARERMPEISRATVYGTLRLFVEHGLLKELVVDGAATVYDSNLEPHHHLYDLDSGEVSDLDGAQLRVLGLPALGPDLEVAEVDVIVRVRRRPAVPAPA